MSSIDPIIILRWFASEFLLYFQESYTKIACQCWGPLKDDTNPWKFSRFAPGSANALCCAFGAGACGPNLQHLILTLTASTCLQRVYGTEYRTLAPSLRLLEQRRQIANHWTTCHSFPDLFGNPRNANPGNEVRLIYFQMNPGNEAEFLGMVLLNYIFVQWFL